MVLWIGIDDTDSLRGMCTTFLATETVRELTRDSDLIGFPRLVRLNPNIPWKTRGNGALALRMGHGTGTPRVIGRIAGRDIVSFPRSRGSEDPEALRRPLEGLMERWSEFEDPTTNPAFAVLRRQPSPGFYWRAVRDIVTRKDARDAASGLGLLRGYKNGRGIIGAVAALAWRPLDRTYELLAYRHPALWGLARTLDPRSVIAMDRAFPSTFNNYDFENGKIVIAPHSPCPVLLGIRGDSAEDLPLAFNTIRGEGAERWLIFETNQGTDDHVARGDWRLRPYTATCVEGSVLETPRTLPGGHVLLELRGRAPVTVAAYEPSRRFRHVVRALRTGDAVRVIGSVRDEPRTLNLEKLEVLSLAGDARKGSNPRCPTCGKRMKSAGRDAGFRCARCRTKAPPSAAEIVPMLRSVTTGWYEPPASARRHLAKPLKRMPTARGGILLGGNAGGDADGGAGGTTLAATRA